MTKSYLQRCLIKIQMLVPQKLNIYFQYPLFIKPLRPLKLLQFFIVCAGKYSLYTFFKLHFDVKHHPLYKFKRTYFFNLTNLLHMQKFALLARLEAKPGKELEVADFLKSALPLVQEEPDTINWYGLQIGASSFGIFDTFETEDGRKAHLEGKVAAALMAKAGALLSSPPVIEMVELLAVK